MNLLSNAYKYTLKGEIEVRLREVSDSHTRESAAELSIRDTGCGIPQTEMPRLYAFYNIDTHAPLL